MEHTQIYPILVKQQIVAYFRYVDDILIIYDEKITNIEHTLKEINELQQNIKFTIEREQQESINFLDITIYRNEDSLQFTIYRKPTQTDIIIPNSSCHPFEHKLSGINYLINRLNTYPITEKGKQIEKNIIKSILQNNGYDTNIIKRLNQTTRKQKSNTHDNEQHKTKWAIFTYSTKEVRKITKLFKDTQIKVAFRTRNTIENILKQKPQIDKYNKSGIYQMKCVDCPLKYIGQTGRTFNTRYKEHIHDIRNNDSNSGYSNHILNTGHAYGTITEVMEVVTTGKKGRHLNTLEKYHIYKISKKGLHMNDTHIETHNPIFQTIHEIYTD
ncbi:hypothetical protein B7P43_G10054 [Cryptotermes secundus]|uniref:Helix-turn-helix domain-containing protein n=1 Tax=Cryptotermes secundus TaxID=105785 RepID=A0A2J7QS31_9NEOP|nr:hypothetical protein B7P43_G10054 [Cryptotermes secundus]